MFMPKLLLRQAFQHHFKYTECVILSLQQKSLLDSMDSQAKISTFFQPLRKRPSEEGNIEIKSSPQEKKAKLQYNHNSKAPDPGLENQRPAVEGNQEDERSTCSSPTSSPEPRTLSPADKKNIEDKRVTAKLKLLSSQSEGLVTNIGPTWFRALEPEFAKPYFQQLSKFVAEERRRHTVYPPADQVFTWTQACTLKEVKVVILGQDPYHGPSQAHGLCFSVQQGVKPPPSLENMYKELTNDIAGFRNPGHGNLTGWAKQGVLLLNAVLTVRKASANSHKDKGWERFTDAVIGWINRNSTNVVFILWGTYAQKKGSCIDKTKHHILKGVHPSPLSAHRGFFGCRHFSQCNDFLESHSRKPINWSNLPPH